MSVTQPEFQHAEPANRLLRLWTFWWQHWPEPFEIGLCKGVSDSAEQRSKGQQANIYAKHSCVGMYEYVASKSWAKLSCISGEDRGWRGHGKNPETEVHTVRERTGRHYLAPPSRASLAVMGLLFSPVVICDGLFSASSRKDSRPLEDIPRICAFLTSTPLTLSIRDDFLINCSVFTVQLNKNR